MPRSNQVLTLGVLRSVEESTKENTRQNKRELEFYAEEQTATLSFTSWSPDGLEQDFSGFVNV